MFINPISILIHPITVFIDKVTIFIDQIRRSDQALCRFSILPQAKDIIGRDNGQIRIRE